MKKIINAFKKSWYIYLITASVGCFSMTYLINYINKPRNEQTISLFVGSCSLNTGNLNNKLKENKPSYLREILINSAIYYSDDYDYVYSSYGKNLSDIIILPESKMFDESITYYYASLDENYIKSYIPDAEFYVSKQEEKSYGVKIRNKGDMNNNLITFSNQDHDENYYAFFYKKSLHGGQLTSSQWSTSLDFVKLIKNG